MFEVVDKQNKGPAVIKVVGVGSGGVNAVNTMITQKVGGVDFIAMNTDVQHLESSQADVTIDLAGPTRGRGAGGDPMKGREAAIQERHRIEEFLRGSDMVVLATGLGGGTGTGATPVVGEMARAMDILTVAVVTLPFGWEGDTKMRVAMEGLESIKKSVDAYVVIPNDKMMKIAPKGLPMRKALALVDQVLCDSVTGVVDLITRPGYINRDFEDVKTVLADCGLCVMGTGVGEGADRAQHAVEAALNNPLLEETPVEGARSILVNIVQSDDGTPEEAALVMSRVKECLAIGGRISFGLAFDDKLTDKMKVSIIASGMDDIEAIDPRTVMEVQPEVTRGIATDSRGMPNFAVRPALSDQEGIDRVRSNRHSHAPFQLNMAGADAGESELDPTPAYLRQGDDRRPTTVNVTGPSYTPGYNAPGRGGFGKLNT
jgi:cell division protein FtsZ